MSGPDQRRFQFYLCGFEALRSHAAGHSASLLVNCCHTCIENVFESGKLRDRFATRSGQNLVRCSLSDKPAILKHEQLFAEHENLIAIVRHVENRNRQILNGAPQIVRNLHAYGKIKGRQWFVKQQNRRLSDQRAGQRDTLTFTARKAHCATAAQMPNAKRIEDPSNPVAALLGMNR